MTVLNFPASPTVGQVYTENDIAYTWTSGGFWEAGIGGSVALARLATLEAKVQSLEEGP